MENTEIRSLAEAKAELEAKGKSIRSWAEEHSLPYQAVLDVLLGRRKGRFGIGHNIAVTLRLKRGELVTIKPRSARKSDRHETADQQGK